MGQDPNILKNIASFIIGKLEPAVIARIDPSGQNDFKTKQGVKFSNGAILQYPKWLLDSKGKDLYKAFKEVFQISPSNAQLFTYFNSVEMIPLELIETLKNLK